MVSGGLSIQGNPWLCTCENSWLGTWLRRWMRETLQLHASITGRDHHIQTMVRTITCQVPTESMQGFVASAVSANAVGRMAASSGGLLLSSSQSSSLSSIQRPLVALSESEAQWTCNALRTSGAQLLPRLSMTSIWTIFCIATLWLL